MTSLLTSSAAGTRAVAAALAELLDPGDVVLLVGELGAGKTTFVQGLGERLGVNEPMTSPTFTLMRTYETEPVLAHVDVWRVEHLGEVLDLGLDELLDEGAIALVEWGDAIAPYLGRLGRRGAITVTLSRTDAPTGRSIEIKAQDASLQGLLAERFERFAPALEEAG